MYVFYSGTSWLSVGGGGGTNAVSLQTSAPSLVRHTVDLFFSVQTEFEVYINHKVGVS